jgi:hypothetical protein
MREALRRWLTDHHAALFRVVFGLFFCVQLGRLLPWAQSLYGATGSLGDVSLSPLAETLPPWWFAWSAGHGPEVLLVSMMGLSLCVAVGLWPRLAAGLLWVGWALLWQRNVFTLNPSMPFNGFLMLAMAAFFPSFAPGSVDRWWAQRRGRPLPAVSGAVPRDLWGVAWAVTAVAYSWSGITKLASPTWLAGDALALILDGPLARPAPWVPLLLQLPLLTKVMAWGTLALETLFAPLALWRRGRALAWAGVVGLHLGIVATIQFAELSLGMLLIHLLTFDPAWLDPGMWRRDATARGG